MAIPEEVVAAVVKDVSERMNDPGYAQLAVGSFVQSQPDVSRFVSAHSDELGSGEGVIHTVFHAEVLAECYRRHHGRPPRVVTFPDLDEAATDDPKAELAKREPALANYVVSNVDEEPVRKLLCHIGLALF